VRELGGLAMPKENTELERKIEAKLEKCEAFVGELRLSADGAIEKYSALDSKGKSSVDYKLQSSKGTGFWDMMYSSLDDIGEDLEKLNGVSDKKQEFEGRRDKLTDIMDLLDSAADISLKYFYTKLKETVSVDQPDRQAMKLGEISAVEDALPGRFEPRINAQELAGAVRIKNM
jgi:hypothetical protein